MNWDKAIRNLNIAFTALGATLLCKACAVGFRLIVVTSEMGRTATCVGTVCAGSFVLVCAVLFVYLLRYLWKK